MLVNMLSVEETLTLHNLKESIEDSTHTIIILRGLPGSGKSTLARKIKEMYGSSVVICSADNYFIMPDGSYEFNAECLAAAHQACKDLFLHTVKSTEQKYVVVVDNTNSTCQEYSYYANYLNLPTFVLEFAHSSNDIAKCADRNVHRVPMPVYDRMFSRWEYDPKAILMRLA